MRNGIITVGFALWSAFWTSNSWGGCYYGRLPWVDGESATPVQKHFSQKILRYDKERIAFALLIGTSIRYEKMRDALRADIASTLGIAFDSEDPAHEGAADWPSQEGEFMKTRGSKEAIDKLLAENVDIRRFRQTLLRSKPFNQVPDIGGFSELHVRIIDAQHVLRAKGALILFKRTDNGYWWVISRALVPLRVHERNLAVVTEVDFMRVENMRDAQLNDDRIVCPVNDINPLGNFDLDRSALVSVQKFLTRTGEKK